MQDLNLQTNEEIIYNSNVYFSNDEIKDKAFDLFLTNLNLILYKKTKKLFSEPKIELIKMPLEFFNYVDGEPFYSVFSEEDYTGLRTIYKRKLIEISFCEDEEKNYINECNILGRLLSNEIVKVKHQPKTCKNCGTQVEHSMSFCKECGYKL